MKKNMLMYRKRCRECGREMLVKNSKEEKCWECKEKFRKKWRSSSVNWDGEE